MLYRYQNHFPVSIFEKAYYLLNFKSLILLSNEFFGIY